MFRHINCIFLSFQKLLEELDVLGSEAAERLKIGLIYRIIERRGVASQGMSFLFPQNKALFFEHRLGSRPEILSKLREAVKNLTPSGSSAKL